MNRLARSTNFHLKRPWQGLPSLSSSKCWSQLHQNAKDIKSSRILALPYNNNINNNKGTTTNHLFFTTSSQLKSNVSTNDERDNTSIDSYSMLERVVSSTSIAQKVHRISSRYDEIMANMVDNSGNNKSSDHDETKELSSLSQVSKLYTEFKSIIDEMNSMNELIDQAKEHEDVEDQKEMIEECQTEIQSMEKQLENIGARLIESILPKNKNDFHADAILEIRAGTGGDEAALFTGELMNCYEKIASHKGWVFDVLSQTKSDLKGVKEAAISISSGNSSGGGGGEYYGGGGDDEGDKALGPYGFFKFESGVHRVQRVPVNDVRIHTSAASVAVLPALSSTGGKGDDLLPASELKIETMRASGAGGQHVNTTDSAVRITHLPTGITASIQDERSQHKNKAKAIKLISARVRDKIEADEARQRGDAKNSLMGGGDRSERIRTYNFPQDRITDHRCKHSEHGIDQLLSGGTGGAYGEDDTGLVGVFLPHMKKMERSETMAALEEEEQATNNGGGGGQARRKKK